VKIAILGSRGIPVNYGGFETLAEEISSRLVKRGHEVTVYCCKPYSTHPGNFYKGVRRIVIPTIRTKVFEKPVFALFSLLHASLRQYDIVLMLGVSISFLCFIPRMFGKKIVINIDGLEWQRKKWGRLISCLLKYEEQMAGVMTDLVVTDSKSIKEYYKRRYGKDTLYIAYGADIIDYPSGDVLNQFGLQKDEYIFYVSRFEPENNALLVREAYDSIDNPAKKLVMVGDAPYADAYIKRVKDTGNPHIIFTGYLYGDAYRELLSNAYVYIQATEVGGTHPALIEAMGAGNCVLANDVPEHREVLRDAGFYYKGKEDLKQKMMFLMDNQKDVMGKKKAAVEVIEKEYAWEKIADEYERLFLNLVEQ
jgi:glycosyltransferase involved in cell wall biosynthesis